MIFDFGRCIYETDDWSLEGYYFNNDQQTEAEYRNAHPHFDDGNCEEIDRFKSVTCARYSILNLNLRNGITRIRNYDNDIEKISKCIRAAITSKSYYVNIPSLEFYEYETKDYEYDCNNYGHVTAYQG